MRKLMPILVVAFIFVAWAPVAEADSPPTVRVNPPQVTFGATTVGEQSTPREIRWTNTSDLTVHIYNWVLYTGDNFDYWNFADSTCGQIGDVLAPHTSCSFEIVFHPSSLGSISGQIVFSYWLTDPSQPEPFVVVPIRGIGK